MPASVIAAVVADFVGTAVAGAVWLAAPAFGTMAFGAISSATAFFVNSAVSSALRGGGPAPAQPVSAQVQQRSTIVRSPVADRELVYGTVQKSGALVHAYAYTDTSASPAVDTLWLVLAVADHEVVGYSGYMLNDESVGTLTQFGTTGQEYRTMYVADTAAKYGNNIFIVSEHLGGTTNYRACPLLKAVDTNWTSAHVLNNIAYVAIRLRYDQKVFPTGIPNIRMTVTGKPLYDFRTATTRTDYAISNPALQVYDYLKTYMGVTDDEIDLASFVSAANICDEVVWKADGTWERRYTSNGVVKLSARHRDNIQQILSSCGGTITAPQGKYRLHVAAYSAPRFVFDEDSLRGPVRVRAAVSKKNLFNAVRGQFVDPARFWQASDFTPQVNATYATEDGEQIFTDLQLPFCTSNTQAQRLARIALEKSRQGITVELQCNLSALQVLPMDNILLNISHLGWDFAGTVDSRTDLIGSWELVDKVGGKVFKVTSVTLSPDGGVDLILQEDASGCYAWSASETTYDLAPNTTLPDPFTMATPGAISMVEELYETTGSAGVKAKAILTWSRPASGFIVDYELEYKLSSSETWLEIFNIRGERYEFLDITPGTYDFRVKARNILGVTSEYTPAYTFQVYGLTTPPADVQNFTVVPFNGKADATWDAPTDLDVKIGGYCVIYYSVLTSGATFSDGYEIARLSGDATSAVLPLVAGTYMAKFVDSSGNYSDTEASSVVVESLLASWTTVTTTTQHDTFTGTKTGCEVSSPNLIMSTGFTTATYEFDTYIDMTTSVARRYHGHIKVRAYNSVGTFDSTDLFDSSEFFDETGTINGCNVSLFVRTTPDDPSGTPTWGEWKKFVVADMTGRAAQFKLEIIRDTENNNIEVQELSVTVKIPA